MKPLDFHPEARVEAKSAFDRYWDQSQAAALRFDRNLRKVYRAIQGSPAICPPYLHGTRRAILTRFPFSIIFRERLHDIQIVAVAHAKRRPGYWAKRL